MKRWWGMAMGALVVMAALLGAGRAARANRYVTDSGRNWAWDEYTKAENGASIEYIGMSSAVNIPYYINYNGAQIPVVSATLHSNLEITDDDGRPRDHRNVAITSISFTLDAEGHTPVRSFCGPNGLRPCLITRLDIPYGVTSVAGFVGCASLREVTLADTVTELHDDCFSGCGALEKIEQEALAQTGLTGRFIVCYPGLTRIGGGAFAHASITGIFLPETVLSVDSGAFTGCDVTVYCVRGSYAEEWANAQGLPCVALEKPAEEE